MKRYGELARQHMEQRLPGIYAGIRDPDEFFTVMGEMIADEIDELACEVAGDDPPGEGYLAKVARLEAARAITEEVVLLPYRDAL